ncbi:zinc metalloproteinase-disintegrin-like batroxstatin-3 [Clytia hemisphaerica]|uniref:Uncharacterized protein n=1 Tax=Clytia hemisphaerica TaxID=252671 RepID=A0A7M5VC51_9CNID|eukprot:TCONS_00019578-protein
MDLHKILIFLVISLSLQIILAEDDDDFVRNGFSVGLTGDSMPEITTNVKSNRYSLEKGPVAQYLSSMLDEKRKKQASRKRRAATIDPIASSKRMYHLEVFVVADNTIYRRFDNDSQKLTDHIHEIFHMVDTMYRPLNFRVTVVGIEIWSDHDQIEFSFTEEPYMNLIRFNSYVQNRSENYMMADHVHLITGKGLFKGGNIGLSHFATVCSPDHATAFTVNLIAPTNFTATVVAHEIGHDLGILHDRPGCQCNEPIENNTCIMSTASKGFEPLPRLFTDCSYNDMVQYYLSTYKPTCLFNVPTVTTDVTSACGNNILDAGEECDCGHPYFCTNPCCNPNTCKLTAGSQCYEGGCCHECKIASKGTCCRTMLDSTCDLPDVCDGSSHVCKDTYKEDRTPCEQGGMCYKGHCQSHASQCQMIWGADTTENGHSECYNLNKRGDWYGHCGSSPGDYSACADQDVKCGKPYCANTPQDYPVVGWRKGVDVLTVKYNDQHTHRCHVPRITFGRNQTNETMVLDGTPCGTNKMCQNQKCIELSTFQSKCSGCLDYIGSCTNDGVCRCHTGVTSDKCEQIHSDCMAVNNNNNNNDNNGNGNDGRQLQPMTVFSLTMFWMTAIELLYTMIS